MVTAAAAGTQSLCRIAIVGGGYSGAMLSVELLRRAPGIASIVLIERGSATGLGAAYGTTFHGHLLNVRAKNMSAYADMPGHFVSWAQRTYNSSVKPDDFLPRRVYGLYIAAQLSEATRFRDEEFCRIQDEAVSLTQAHGRVEIGLAGGRTVIADKVVLALGNFPPANLRLPGKTPSSAYFISNPWSSTALASVQQHEKVLLVGSGLTSVDVTLELRARGVEGIIHILSRRGLLPERHAPVGVVPCQMRNFPRTARGLLRMTRLLVRAAENRGSDWREVIDSLRPVTHQIWRSMPIREQRRFLRHLRTYWDVHRHRIAECIADQLATQLGDGRIQLHAGRIVEYREFDGGVEISYRDRHAGSLKSLRVHRVINCTGPDGDFRRVNSPFLAGLLKKGLVRPDEHFLGLDVADDGAVIDSRGKASDSIYAVGPLRKGKLWESVAVPELRVQTAELAKLLIHCNCREESNLAFASGEVETVRS
jgi:uncharacterized NAD(P)/FAD-binding protein YdhS